jgi:hypothetical protein
MKTNQKIDRFASISFLGWPFWDEDLWYPRAWHSLAAEEVNAQQIDGFDISMAYKAW